MSAGREGRHAQRPATKEVFYVFSGGSGGADFSAVGGHGGWRVNADNEYIYCECYIPHDFKSLVDAKIVFLELATLTPMTFRAITDWCQAETNYFQHSDGRTKIINTVLPPGQAAGHVRECDFRAELLSLIGAAGLEAKDYLGVQVSRQAGQNTNAIFLGVRIRYK